MPTGDLRLSVFLPIPLPTCAGLPPFLGARPAACLGAGCAAVSAMVKGDATAMKEVMRMGGLFRAPKPAIVAAPEPPPTAPATPSVEQVGQDARVEARARAGRGLAGTIATSARGVLDPLPGVALVRKSLLGE